MSCSIRALAVEWMGRDGLSSCWPSAGEQGRVGGSKCYYLFLAVGVWQHSEGYGSAGVGGVGGVSIIVSVLGRQLLP